MKVYVLTMGRDLYYVAKDSADAEYEKQLAEEETLLGRKLGIKLSEVEIDENNPESKVKLANGCEYTVEDIMYLL